MSSIRQRYEALNLRVLDKVEISMAGWAALEKGSVNQSDPEYKVALPIVVAKFRATAAKQMMVAAYIIPIIGTAKASLDRFAWARATMSTKYVPAYMQYKSDISSIDEVLFGKNQAVLMDGRAGKFNRPEASSIHTDVAFSGPNERSYLSRLGALPALYVRRYELDALPAEQRERAESTLRRAIGKDEGAQMGKDESAEIIKAKQELTDMGILKMLPLGEVGLIAGQYDSRSDEEHMRQQETFGRIPRLDPMACLDTLHSSSELPVRDGKPKPTYSAFQRSVFNARRDFV